MLKTSKLIANTSIFVFAGLIALVTTSCGTSKVAQCTSLVEIVKDVEKTAIDLLDSPSDNNSDDKAQGFSNMGIKLQSFQRTLQALDIQDEKLKGFQSRLATLYGKYQKLSGQMAQAIRAKDNQSFNKYMAEIKAADIKEKALLKESGEYCDAP
jgi:hypothetical protein